MKLFIDECLSPSIAHRLNASEQHDALHPRDYGRLGERDDQVLSRCLAEDRTLVTENAVDFRKLVAAETIHPGLIIMPSVSREACWELVVAAISHLEALGDPAHVMVNHVLEVDALGHNPLSTAVGVKWDFRFRRRRSEFCSCFVLVLIPPFC